MTFVAVLKDSFCFPLRARGPLALVGTSIAICLLIMGMTKGSPDLMRFLGPLMTLCVFALSAGLKGRSAIAAVESGAHLFSPKTAALWKVVTAMVVFFLVGGLPRAATEAGAPSLATALAILPFLLQLYIPAALAAVVGNDSLRSLRPRSALKAAASRWPLYALLVAFPWATSWINNLVFKLFSKQTPEFLAFLILYLVASYFTVVSGRLVGHLASAYRTSFSPVRIS